MSTLNYNKQKLIDQLKKKKAEYEQNLSNEKAKAHENLVAEIEGQIQKHQQDLELVKAGKEPKEYYSRYYRVNGDTSPYDVAIAQLEACEDITIKLSDKSDVQILRLIA